MDDDLPTQKQRLEQVISDYIRQEYPCEYDPSSGHVDCNDFCISKIADDFECPEKILYEGKRDLSRLSLRRLLVLAFHSPNIARANDLLSEDLFLSEK
jgi:hypothetical protein